MSINGKKNERNAVILAAGFGTRMVPINLSTPKALLKVKGEPLIERSIKQLHNAGIEDITVVVGFMKEAFEYLIDEYNVELLVNEHYAVKNNLHSLALAADRISDTFVIPSDVWCEENPYIPESEHSWYMIKVNCDEDEMIGISFISSDKAPEIREKLISFDKDEKYDNEFWETVLYENGKMNIPFLSVNAEKYVEINTYEQLRELDGDSLHLKNDALDLIAKVFKTKPEAIHDIKVLKKGMTNRSFLFSVDGNKYIMRIPGEGTDKLINRENEAAVFKAISGYGLCDDPVYINPENGYKITKFLDGVRVCDCENENDLAVCMEKLRYFHSLKLSVPHTFDIFGQIEFYESLWDSNPSVYKDYETTKKNVLSLKSFIDSCQKDWCLTHIDAVPDNFLFYETENGEQLQLTDWEYSGMQDPHVDIAMFCIYSLYDKKQVDSLIDIYFENNCPETVRTKIYAYIASCGLLWSNWCEFKRNLGVEFGEYSIRQYHYAKEYYKYVKESID